MYALPSCVRQRSSFKLYMHEFRQYDSSFEVQSLVDCNGKQWMIKSKFLLQFKKELTSWSHKVLL